MNTQVLDQLQKRFGSADFSRYQVLRGQKYDFVRLNTAGVNQVAFFTNPIGATDPVANAPKTLEQTNSVKSASFGQEYFAITQIRTYAGFLPKARQPAAISGDADAVWQGYSGNASSAMEALNDLLHRGVLNIRLAQKLYYQIQQPFLTAPAGFGVAIQSFAAAKTAAAAAKPSYWVTPDNRATSVYNIDPIQIIEPEIQIEATIDFPDLNSPAFTNTFFVGPGNETPSVEVGLIFDGYVIRPSQ